MMSSYPACFFKEKLGYTVIFPDLCASTCGSTLDEADNMAVDLLAGILFNTKEDGLLYPDATIPDDQLIETALNLIGEDYIFQESFIKVVSVDVDEYAEKNFK